MKIVKPLAALLLLAIATHLHSAEEAPKPSLQAVEATHTYSLTAVCFADTLASEKPSWILILNSLAYRTVNSLKPGLERLPKGSIVRWEPSDARIGGEPLTTPEEMASLKKMCDDNELQLTVIPAG